MEKFAVEIKWGIIFIISGLCWVWLEKLFGLHDVYVAQHPLYTNLFGIIAVTLFVFALLEKRRNFFDGTMTWKEGFTSGIIMTIVITILSPLSQWITYEFISPEFFNNIKEHTYQTTPMSREEAENYFSLRSYIIQATFGALTMGVVTSAIVAWIVKTKQPKAKV